ncbi:MAG: Hsp20/alpha crystallin family protein [Ignavibacteria bacterium]|nr:Hsp20/alpha crystallin family protein [Ignavibacteria bacterium]
MTIVRWNPGRELATFPQDVLNMQREINKMFEGFLRGGLEEDTSLFPSAWTPAVDVAEHANEYIVKVELPGVSKDDVKIVMQDNILTIRGDKKQESETKESDFHRVERSYGSFQRSFTLPTSVRNDRIEANFMDGILSITLPKAEEARPKQIEIKVK